MTQPLNLVTENESHPLDGLEVKKSSNLQWPDLIPLNYSSKEEQPYPIDALPTSLQKAVLSYQEYGQQPLPLVASSALANMSLACQALANVARDKHLISPTSMYFLLVANSGERKSAIDNAFSKAARHWESSLRQKSERSVKTAISQHKAWKMEHDGLLNQIKRTAYTGEDPEHFKAILEEHDNNEPEIPLLPTLYFEDATLEALAIHLAHGWPSAAFWSDEAGIILGSHSMKNNPTRFVALLNRLWDGKSTTAHRKTSQSFTIQNRRLTLNLMMQPLLFSKMHPDASGINRQSGFMARCLMAYPATNMGNRFYKEPPEDSVDLGDYEDKITDCLKQSEYLTEDGCINLPTVFMSQAAKARWIDFFNMIEAGLSKNSQWGAVTDFASKSAENVARLAGLFHLFEGKEGDISTEHVEQSIEVINWHLHEAKRLLTNDADMIDVSSAMKLLDWLVTNKSPITTFRQVQKFGPFRKKEDLDKIVTLLVENNYIQNRRENRKNIIELNPSLL